MDWLTEPFELAFQQRALVAGVLAAVALALVGTWVVIRGMAFLGDALVHGVVPGIALAVIFDFNPLIGAAGAALVMILGINYIRSRTSFGDDTGIGLLFVGMLALGVILLRRHLPTRAPWPRSSSGHPRGDQGTSHCSPASPPRRWWPRSCSTGRSWSSRSTRTRPGSVCVPGSPTSCSAPDHDGDRRLVPTVGTPRLRAARRAPGHRIADARRVPMIMGLATVIGDCRSSVASSSASRRHCRVGLDRPLRRGLLLPRPVHEEHHGACAPRPRPSERESAIMGAMTSRPLLKWNYYEPDVLAAWVAEMDFGLAPAVTEALHRAVDLGDTGYPYPALSRLWPRRRPASGSGGSAWTSSPIGCSRPRCDRGRPPAIVHLTEPGSPVVLHPPVYFPFY